MAPPRPKLQLKNESVSAVVYPLPSAGETRQDHHIEGIFAPMEQLDRAQQQTPITALARPQKRTCRSTSLKLCEDCGDKRPSYGLDSEGRVRWCSSCGKQHPMAHRLRSYKKCEDCHSKVPSYGMPKDEAGNPLRLQRWCSECAHSHHPGAVNLTHKMKCKDCGSKAPSFGMKAEGKKKWCGPCAKEHHPGAINLNKRKQCEDCGAKTPNYGLRSEWKRRWCMACVKVNGHPGAELLLRRKPKLSQPTTTSASEYLQQTHNIDNVGLMTSSFAPNTATNTAQNTTSKNPAGSRKATCNTCGRHGHNSRTCPTPLPTHINLQHDQISPVANVPIHALASPMVSTSSTIGASAAIRSSPSCKVHRHGQPHAPPVNTIRAVVIQPTLGIRNPQWNSIGSKPPEQLLQRRDCENVQSAVPVLDVELRSDNAYAAPTAAMVASQKPLPPMSAPARAFVGSTIHVGASTMPSRASSTLAHVPDAIHNLCVQQGMILAESSQHIEQDNNEPHVAATSMTTSGQCATHIFPGISLEFAPHGASDAGKSSSKVGKEMLTAPMAPPTPPPLKLL